MKILVIDDDREFCSMLSELFQQRGFSVECERDGIRGLGRAGSEAFDLLILDVMLPGVDGFAGASDAAPAVPSSGSHVDGARRTRRANSGSRPPPIFRYFLCRYTSNNQT